MGLCSGAPFAPLLEKKLPEAETALLEHAPEFLFNPMTNLSLLWQHSVTPLNRETCTVVLYQIPLACASKRETEVKSPELTATAVQYFAMCNIFF